MQLLCVGDVAFTRTQLPGRCWPRPVSLPPGTESRILLNWEFPVGQTINPVPRLSGPRLIAPPDACSIIENWAPGFAALATNHILDAGISGLAGTLQELTRVGFETVGAGLEPAEIMSPIIWETAEGRLAIVNWVFPETHPDWDRVPGPNCWPGSRVAKSIIDDLRQGVDWVVVVVHWSDELFPYPRPEDRQRARELARMGADVVVGHHPHVVRGMELVEGRPVFYSIGNFYFADVADGCGGWELQEAPRNREGLGVVISLRQGQKPECRTVSFWNNGREVICDPQDRAGKRLAAVSRPLRNVQDSEYAAWYRGQRARFDRWDARWHFGIRRRGLYGSVRHHLQKILS